jgi:adenosylcobyric acid synthase
VVVRSPRLAVTGGGDDGVAVLLTGALVQILRAWHIPVVLFTDGLGGHSDAPWSAVHLEPFAALEELADGPLEPARNAWAMSNGGDVTLITGPAEAVRRLAERMRTPVVAALPADAEGWRPEGPVAGFVSIGGPARERDALRALGLADYGSLPARDGLTVALAEPDDPIADLSERAADGIEELGAGLDLLGLLRLGNTAPVLVPPGGAWTAPAGRRPRGRPRMPVALTVQGTHSSVGKSFLVTALARYFSDRGLRVAPFKGQNMSNNARVVRGGEIGVAQYLQALAARIVPDVRMNPVLLKPQSEGSHVVLMGRPEPALTALPWRLRKPAMWPAVREALHELMADYDLVLIEGAGSPAEPYMYHNDIVNMRVAREAGAPAVIVSDAGQGGAIAQTYGTWRLLPDEDRSRVRGFLFNKFYAAGYVDLFLPGCAQLEHLTGVPSLGVLPVLDHALPEEDLHSLGAGSGEGDRRVAIVVYPRISNFDEFAPLTRLPGVRVVWARGAADLSNADLVILPGSRHVAADLEWMREAGVDVAVREHAASGRPLLGVCGGLQMLGDRLEDPEGVEGAGPGLGLLPLVTVYRRDKVQVHTSGTFSGLGECWAGLNGLPVSGYEIRHGSTSPTGPVDEVLPNALGFARENVLAISVHGMFESSAVMRALFAAGVDAGELLESTFDRLSAALCEHLDMVRFERLLT